MAEGAGDAPGHLAALSDGLGPALRDATAGRLDHVEWFRTTWQHGGAATGFADWRRDDGRRTPVMVKIPVNQAEFDWTCALGLTPEDDWDARAGQPTPRVAAAADTLAGRPLRWLAMERLPLKAGSVHPTAQEITDLLGAAAAFHGSAAAARPHTPPTPRGADSARPDWADLLHRTRDAVKTHGLPEAQRWNEALKKGQRLCDRLQAQWETRPIDTWCHGDLHLGNAMRRAAPDGDGSVCVLIDFALIRRGNWVEDAVYLEHLYWARPEHLHGLKPVSLLARFRREAGLSTAGDYARLANLWRFLLAATTPLSAAHEGRARPSHAALEALERLLPQVAH